MKPLALLIAALCIAAEPAKQPPKDDAPATRAEVDRLRKQVAELATEVGKLRVTVRALLESRGGTGASSRPHGEATDDDLPAQAEVKAAIKDNRLLVGMTFDEAKQALGPDPTLVSAREGGYSEYRWWAVKGQVYRYATFRNGRLIEFSTPQGTVEGNTGRPAPSGGFNPFGFGPAGGRPAPRR